MNRIYYVYAWFREDHNTIFYVGKGKDGRYLRLDNRKPYFMNIYNSVPTHVKILKGNLTEEEALDLEKKIIKHLVFKQGYSIDVPAFKGAKVSGRHLVNLTWGGDGTSGYTYKQSQETIASRVAKNTGKKRTPAQRENLKRGARKRFSNPQEVERLRTLRKGYVTSEKTKQLLREQRLGKRITEEHKQKIRESYLALSEAEKEERRKHQKENTRKAIGRSIYCIELDKHFTSISEANDYFRETFNQPINYTQMRLLLNGTAKKDWYKEVNINGVLTKLHWRDC